MPEYFHSRMAELIFKYLSDSLTDQEKEELRHLLTSSPKNQQLFEELTSPDIIIPAAIELGQEDSAASWERFSESVSFTRHSIPIWKRLAAAVGLLIAVGTVTYFIVRNSNQLTNDKKTNPTSISKKSKNKSFIKRKDKPLVSLDTIPDGILGYLGYEPILKNDSEVIYPKSLCSDLEYIRTEGDGYFQFGLPDGSKVWLCGSSTLRISSNFNISSRDLAFDGTAAYFDVQHDSSKPFLVQTNGIGIEDIGTRFNINSFGNGEIVKTNLFEGMIKLIAAGKETLVSPGEQVIVRKSKHQKKNALQVRKNKAGGIEKSLIVFQQEDLNTALKEITKYYGYDITFANPFPKKTLNATFHRQYPLLKILDFITEVTAINFKIEEQTVVVNP